MLWLILYLRFPNFIDSLRSQLILNCLQHILEKMFFDLGLHLWDIWLSPDLLQYLWMNIVANKMALVDQSMTKYDEHGSIYDQIWWKSMILGPKIGFYWQKIIFLVKTWIFGIKNTIFENMLEIFRNLFFPKKYFFTRDSFPMVLGPKIPKNEEKQPTNKN